MISLAFLATVINYLDRQTLSVVAPVITEQFRMSNVDYSRVVFAFMLAYTIMNGVSGPMVDRLGTKLGYAVCVGWWSIAAMLHALARGPLSLGVFRFLLGMGEAGNWPAGVKVVSEWFPPKERAFASGIFKSGDPAKRARAIVQATTHYNDPLILAEVSEDLGVPMVGINIETLAENQKMAGRGW
ncbi:MAG TPA: MFS transporter [Bryobacteraceae bacterium]|nr:MFS transporter [Bryobacteraceae bacterium]